MPDHDAVRQGRKHTSGKECLPMTVTLGSVLQRIRQGDDRERYAFFMPATQGPCRFGMYNLLDKVIFEMLGLRDRVRVVSQPESDFFHGVPPGAALRIWASFVAADLLEAMLHHVRPVETAHGAARRVYDAYYRRVSNQLEASPAPGFPAAVAGLAGNLFGLRPLLARAAQEFAAVADVRRRVPTVAVVGEIYVRCDPFSNDFVIERLEERGLRVKFAPFSEFIEYVDWINTAKRDEKREQAPQSRFVERGTVALKRRVLERLYAPVRCAMGWPDRLRVADTLASAAPYLSTHLHGEAVLTLGGPIHEYDAGQILGVVNVGPLECMPSKVAEAQFFHVAEQKGLIPLTLSLNGEPADPELLDNFAYEVHARFVRAGASARTASEAAPPKNRMGEGNGRGPLPRFPGSAGVPIPCAPLPLQPAPERAATPGVRPFHGTGPDDGWGKGV
jgi:predicted nucleotide-binding protein (sugar kinase/HSP70/actin superfamily)